MKIFKPFCLYTLLLFCFVHYAFAAYDVTITGLKTEYTATPLGIDVKKPRFSWQMISNTPGAAQKAYMVIVTDETGKTTWNSGRVTDDKSLNILYDGKPLAVRTRYQWVVKVWDLKSKVHTAASWFETGLMDDKQTAWSGAKWIGGGDDDMLLYAQYLPVFKLNFTIQLNSETQSTRGGLLYGANDQRLLDKNKNYYGIQSSKDSSSIFVELDIAPLNTGAAALLNIYRSGYKPGDQANKPIKTLPLPLALINKDNRYNKHTIYLSSVMGNTEFWVDGEGKENHIGRLGLNPIGQGGDFIAFPVLANIGFKVPEHQSASFSNLVVSNFRGPSNVLHTSYKQPLLLTGTNKPTMLIYDPSRNSMPMMRSSFDTKGSNIRKARLYVTARGIYDVYMNGKRVNDDYFNPGLTQYTRTQLYQTFDVTKNMVAGKNAIGAILGEGWWSGGSTYSGDNWNFFGDRQSLLAKLVVSYEDGKEEVIVSLPETWRYNNNGPVIYGSFFQGEVYDARKETAVQGWSTSAYDDSRWKKATEVKLEGNINTDLSPPDSNTPSVAKYSHLSITGQFGETVKKVKELTARSVEQVRPGVFVYDLGQNIAGVPRIELNGLQPGTQITLRFAEVKYPNLPAYKGNTGMIMLENIRAAMAQEIYIARGGHEFITPRFTYHGLRYIEVTGIQKALPIAAVRGVVLSSVHQFSSGYECSDPLVNRLWENINWSTLANFMSIPTDCPQRNERLGWSGDISVFSKTATYLANIPQFLRRHMLAMRDVQRDDGRFSDVAPLGGGFGDILWGSAGITVAWESYQQYEDVDMLKEHYEAMSKYITFMTAQIDAQTNVMDDKNRTRWASLGDWLSPEYDKTEKSLLWEAYYIYDLQRIAEIAALLGKTNDYKRYKQLALERMSFFNNTYIDKATGKTAFRNKPVDTQTSYAVPLAFGIVNEDLKTKVAANFVETVSRANTNDKGQLYPPYSLMTGFIGTAWVSSALSQTGNTSTAYRQLLQTTYPSWLYPVKQGATTIWERLNSYTHTDGFGGNNNMNSFNHYSFGAVGAWLLEHSSGIQRDALSPGFKHFILAPEPDVEGKMKHAKGYYDSMYGRIESSWILKTGGVVYNINVPANTSATVILKGTSIFKLVKQKNGQTLKVKISEKKNADGNYRFEVAPGKYQFEVIQK
ncbi:alpha-L-rhamnosidase [Mucilaginibacter terrae]|uniref:alpha-L-rhamnosidase n=1 Tax=Mucilaginibacter terrae TaxID=1955052 RepID=A0ABU3GZU1_9SPHI|nr:family 78 glycoside hydrolase catalytic domain [Mucilaginibacter terrae]MDT3405282.1 alpha-L-rhamnosidase [Mucilaginibacter terrae]